VSLLEKDTSSVTFCKSLRKRRTLKSILLSIFPGKGLEFYAHLSGTPLSGADGGLAAPFVFDSRDALQVCLLRGFSSGEAEDGITLIEAGEIFTGK
jgi:hypothetical protein